MNSTAKVFREDADEKRVYRKNNIIRFVSRYCPENFMKLKRPSIFNSHFAYVETSNYLGRQLLRKYGLQPKIYKWYVDKERDWQIVCCSVKKGQEEIFAKAMGELREKMPLMGRMDYVYACDIYEEILEMY